MWNLPPPPGFMGLRDDVPLKIYIRHLPHWRQQGATYFATFRLLDSLPQAKLRELADWRREWERRHPPPRNDDAWHELSREVMRRVEAWLDQGMGSCLLGRREAAAKLKDAMHHFDTHRYELASYVIMPNHVHVIVRPLECDSHPLEKILQSWKLFAARHINEQLRQHGHLWQEESFDRIVRDEEHLYRCVQYIGANPAKAGIPRESCLRWIRPEWEALGWRFTDEP